MVVVPAVVESGASVQFCVALLQLSEQLTVTVTLEKNGVRRLLYNHTDDEDKYKCATFQAPVVETSLIQNFEVDVQGKKFHQTETRKIQIRNYGVKTFIQTDKPLYLPGQTVNFRVLTLDSALGPAKESYDMIEVKDPMMNRVAQWLDRSSEGKILQLSYELPPEAKEGPYTLSVTPKGSDKTHLQFEVEKYVLPKFSVEIKAPSEVNVAQEQMELQVCAKYTFGQSVPGLVELQMCRLVSTVELFDYGTRDNDFIPLCHREQQQVAKDGCAAFSIQMEQFKGGSRMSSDFTINARMIEEGTGVEQNVEHKVTLSYVIGKVEFVDPPQRFNKGDILDFKVRVLHHNHTAVSNTTVHLKRGTVVLQSHQTDQHGLSLFRVNTSTLPEEFSLTASVYSEYVSTYRNPHFSQSSVTLREIQAPSLHTKTSSSVEVQAGDRTLLCGATEAFTVRYTFVGEGTGTATLVYLVLSRGAIVKYGHSSNYMDTMTQGELTFSMDILPEMAPSVTVVVYAVLPSESVVAASRDFQTEKCFSNKVLLEFSPPSSVPGEDTSLKLSASPRSLCGLSAVDKSVSIKKPGKSLDPDKFFGLLPVTIARTFSDQLEDPLGCVKVRNRRYIPRPHRNRGPKDVYTILKEVGLKMATNLFIRTPSCVNFRGTEYHQHSGYGPPVMRYKSPLRFGVVPEMIPLSRPGFGGFVALPPPPPPPPPPPVETVRTFFPETWIWDLVEVGDSGSASLALTVPDTITTWESEAFCLSPQGFGLAPRQELTVFQPFFLQLSLPYSLIRGESFQLKATVFNYLSSCIMVKVTPEPSSDFTLTPLSGDLYESCLCGSETKTLRWTMLPSALGVVNVTVRAEAVPSQVQCDNEVLSVPERGRVDVVTKQLRVKAEGTEVVKTYNWLLCPKGDTLKELVDLSLPDTVIPGSARASVSVLGDILGRALKNLDGMLRMPYGCGEQNMALLAPNIYILQYLQDTQQLSQEVMERALKFLSSGYQRQLNYKHLDGSYSAFGRGEGNTWLTAFVLRCFSRARAFVYIDTQKLGQSLLWLQSRQKEDGCFRPSGKLFNNRMKGGVSDDVTLSAYITAAFLEMNMSKTDPVMEKSLSCLRNNSRNMENLYTTALMAYVFSLAGDTETRAELLNKLNSQAHDEGGQLYWSSPSSSSLSVEISSYALLSSLTQSQLSVEELGYASKIVRWLTGQQNPYGGFSSTQDTVVALQALALYSTVVFSPEGSSSVLVQGPAGSSAQPLSFTVEPSNKLLYQEQPLEGATGQYSLEVKGSACASAQIFVRYNIPTPSKEQSVGVKAEAQMDCQTTVLNLNLTAHYFGDHNSSNMIILDIKALSGFIPDQQALKHLEHENLVDRVEQKDDHVLIYIRELSRFQTVSYSLRLMRETSVENLKPAVVKIYDYYTPNDQAETEYSSPCADPALD